jgi:metallo-beta-lactamase family protein
MFGHDYTVRARVVTVPLSAHADRSELVDWIETAGTRPGTVFVNHGEPDASSALADRLRDDGIVAVVPEHGSTHDPWREPVRAAHSGERAAGP